MQIFNKQKSDKMIISTLDSEMLIKCIRAVEGRHTTKFDEIQMLKKKISTACRVKPQDVPRNIVTMNSFVELQRSNTGTAFTIKLVFPEFENIKESRISIFSALGAAIFSEKVGDEVVYMTWKNENHIKITDVIFQPEANGNYYVEKHDYGYF
jgi:regulator of nucleoside diphosphate kinase